VDGSDALFIVAELAIAIAGFASLAVVIGQRRGRDEPEVDALRLRAMLEASLLVVAASLFPLFPFYANASPEAVWRSSSAVLGIAVPLLVILQLRRLNLVREVYRPGRLYAGVQLALAGSASICLWSNAAGVLPGFHQGAYFWGLFALLSYSSIMFVRLIQSLLGRPPPE
jgi:hypothetical protein